MRGSDPISVEHLIRRIRPGRDLDGCTAVLLPYTPSGAIDWDSFRTLLRRTQSVGLTPAVNMDTGYGPHLDARERTEVLRTTRETLGEGRRFIGGAGIFGFTGAPLDGYRASVEEIRSHDGTPIIFQSAWLSAQRDRDLVAAYRAIVDGGPAIGFELGEMFAPFGRIYSLDEYRRLLDIEGLIGAKHSSLDRFAELERLSVRDAERPGFRVYTGNDLAIDMVMYGSDYLLGLSTFDPDAFALRDAWWRDGDARFYPLNDALQALGMIAFRPPVPAYKHSAACYLALTGHVASSEVHPDCPRRDDWETELLRPYAELIGRAMDAPMSAEC